MATPKTVSFDTLGCKLNFSETSTIRRQFEGAGYQVLPSDEGTDIYILNTCSVTEQADKKCRQHIRRALRLRPDAIVIVIGCYAQLKPEQIATIKGVDMVLGAAEKFNILQYIDTLSNSQEKGLIYAGDVREANSFTESFSFGDRTRSFLKVQDGCDYKCTFCTIPKARGASRSPNISILVNQAKDIASRDVKEIVITGVNVGDFGKNNNNKEDFLDLITELDQIKGINRFRISSIEPNLLTYKIIDFVANSDKFVPHFHIPLQSGNNKQLAQMRRRYKRELYAERIAYIRKQMPHCAIGVDVIVGFPGETDDDFLETYHFIQALDVTYLHVFTYSERDHTPAAKMEGAVSVEKRRKRNKMLQILSLEKRTTFYQKYLGLRREVLFEKHANPKLMTGFTDNYIKVITDFDAEMINQVNVVQLMKLNNHGMVEIINQDIPEGVFEYV